jgi:peptidoglycan/LPS O-acetylase OafA/YrhL
MPKPPSASPRLDALDAMRGYAILGVVLVHTAQWTKPAAPWAIQLCASGARGVQLFFVASAFALFLSHGRSSTPKRHPVAGFFIRRFFRVAPMFYVGLVYFLLRVGLRPQYWAPRGLTPLAVAVTALFLHGWHPETINSLVPGGWSIAAEAMFYLLLPLLFRLVTSRTAAWAFLGFTLLLDPWMTRWLAPVLTPAYPAGFEYLADNFRYFWIFAQLPVFALGIVLYFLLRDRLEQPDRRLGLGCLVLAAALGAVLFCQPHPTDPPSFAIGVLYGVAFLLFGLALNLTHSRVLINRPVVFLGKVSYSLYFVHFAIFQYLFPRWPGGLPVRGPWATPLAFVLVLPVAAGIAFLTYRLVELPGIALGRKLAARIEGGRAAHPAEAC